MNFINSQLLRMAKDAAVRLDKVGFVDPSAMAAGGPPSAAGGPPGGDPSGGGGGAPPPGAGGPPPGAGGPPPGADPSQGAPPAGALDPGTIQQIVQAVTQAGGGAGGAGGAAGLKPKIDVNVELMQIKKMLARLLDNLGVQVPASDMVATSQDLMQMAQNPGAHPDAAAGGGAGGSAISPISPIQGASPGLAAGGGGHHHKSGEAAGLEDSSERAQAIMAVLRRREAA